MNDNKSGKTDKEDWSKRELGALWLKTSNGGQKYFTGHINTQLDGKLDIVVFSNKNKQKDSAPDFRIYLSEKSGKKTTTEESAAPARSVPRQTQRQTVEVAASSESDDDGIL